MLPAEAQEREFHWDPYQDLTVTCAEAAVLSGDGPWMDEAEYKAAYEAMEQEILTGLVKGQDQIAVVNQLPDMNADKIAQVYLNTILDNPERTAMVHTAVGISYEKPMTQPGGQIWLKPRYDSSVLGEDGKVDESLYQRYQERFKAALNEACRTCFAEGMTPLEKVVVAHDFLVGTVQYDPYVQLNHSLPGDGKPVGTVPETPRGYRYEPNWHVMTPYGCLVERNTVCQGYALTMKAMLDRAGVPCVFVNSAAMGHAWNMVQLEGKWYHVDVTWDDPGVNSVGDWAGHVERKYLLKGDAAMQNQEHHHDWSTKNNLSCPEDWDWGSTGKPGEIPVVQYKGRLYTALRSNPDRKMDLVCYTAGKNLQSVEIRKTLETDAECGVLDPDTGVFYLLKNRSLEQGWAESFYEGWILSMDLNKESLRVQRQVYRKPCGAPENSGYRCGLVLGATGELTRMLPDGVRTLSIWTNFYAQEVIPLNRAPVHEDGNVRIYSSREGKPTITQLDETVFFVANRNDSIRANLAVACYGKGQLLSFFNMGKLFCNDIQDFCVGGVPEGTDTVNMFLLSEGEYTPIMRAFTIT